MDGFTKEERKKEEDKAVRDNPLSRAGSREERGSEKGERTFLGRSDSVAES